jgi:hypothetical protein
MKVAVDCERYCVDGSVMLAMQNVCLLVEEAEQVERQVCRASNISYLPNSTTYSWKQKQEYDYETETKQCHFKKTDFNQISNTSYHYCFCKESKYTRCNN